MSKEGGRSVIQLEYLKSLAKTFKQELSYRHSNNCSKNSRNANLGLGNVLTIFPDSSTRQLATAMINNNNQQACKVGNSSGGEKLLDVIVYCPLKIPKPKS